MRSCSESKSPKVQGSPKLQNDQCVRIAWCFQLKMAGSTLVSHVSLGCSSDPIPWSCRRPDANTAQFLLHGPPLSSLFPCDCSANLSSSSFTTSKEYIHFGYLEQRSWTTHFTHRQAPRLMSADTLLLPMLFFSTRFSVLLGLGAFRFLYLFVCFCLFFFLYPCTTSDIQWVLE